MLLQHSAFCLQHQRLQNCCKAHAQHANPLTDTLACNSHKQAVRSEHQNTDSRPRAKQEVIETSGAVNTASIVPRAKLVDMQGSRLPSIAANNFLQNKDAP